MKIMREKGDREGKRRTASFFSFQYICQNCTEYFHKCHLESLQETSKEGIIILKIWVRKLSLKKVKLLSQGCNSINYEVKIQTYSFFHSTKYLSAYYVSGTTLNAPYA